MTTDFFADVEDATPADEAAMLAELTDVLVRDWTFHPRGLQTAIGCSEIGHPCGRKLAAKVAGVAPVNSSGDPLPAWTGVACHSSMQQVFERENARLGRERYLLENRVEVGPGLSGSADLFDSDFGRVIDWKFVNPTRLAGYRKSGPPPEYVVQCQSYGRGFANAGHTVNSVGIVFFPRGGQLAKSHIWTQPYDPAVGEAAVARLALIHKVVGDLNLSDPVNHPALMTITTPTPDRNCTYCPYYSAKPPVDGRAYCDGKFAP
jgi:hypothetical protein